MSKIRSKKFSVSEKKIFQNFSELNLFSFWKLSIENKLLAPFHVGLNSQDRAKADSF